MSTPLAEENTNLRQLLQKLNGFAGHDDDCVLNNWGSFREPCNCGYAEVRDAVQRVLANYDVEPENETDAALDALISTMEAFKKSREAKEDL